MRSTSCMTCHLLTAQSLCTTYFAFWRWCQQWWLSSKFWSISQSSFKKTSMKSSFTSERIAKAFGSWRACVVFLSCFYLGCSCSNYNRSAEAKNLRTQATLTQHLNWWTNPFPWKKRSNSNTLSHACWDACIRFQCWCTARAKFEMLSKSTWSFYTAVTKKICPTSTQRMSVQARTTLISQRNQYGKVHIIFALKSK